MIESFADGISTWVVWHGCRLLDVIHGVQLGYYGIFQSFCPYHCECGPGFHTHRNHFSTKILATVNAFWLLVMKARLNLVEGISQYQDVFLYHPLMGQLLENQYTTGPEDYWQLVTPDVYVDLCNDPLQCDTNGNW